MSAPPYSYTFREKGLLNLPGITHETKKTAEELLLKDAQEHHCFYRLPSIHNHLPHHVLAAYDLGASASLLRKKYDIEAKKQIPILLDESDKDVVITDENWLGYTGNLHAYSAFVAYFSEQVRVNGVTPTLERYIFEPTVINGTTMLIRFLSGAFHPLIQVGYGIEFGLDILVANGLAMTAVQPPVPALDIIISPENPPDATHNNSSSGFRQPSRGPSLLEILRQVYDSPILEPGMPYIPNHTIYDQAKQHMGGGRPEEIRRICAQYYIDEDGGEEEFESKIEEFVWIATLMMYGTGKEGRKPRLDFFLMHLVTSAYFFGPVFKFLPNPKHKAKILRAFLPTMVLFAIHRGRPVVKPELLMSYTTTPRPPVSPESRPKPDETAVGSPLDDADYNPWHEMIASCIYAPDSHVLKVMRALVISSKKYGHTLPGDIIGAYRLPSSSEDNKEGKVEVIKGISQVDGTIFVRAAGMTMDSMGWITHGQPARVWDRTGLGWEDAWKYGEQ